MPKVPSIQIVPPFWSQSECTLCWAWLLSVFRRHGLGALDVSKPFGSAWGRKLRSLPIFRRNARDGNERHERMKCRFVSFVTFLQAGFVLLDRDLVIRCRTSWSGSMEWLLGVESLFWSHVFVLNTFFSTYFFVGSLCFTLEVSEMERELSDDLAAPKPENDSEFQALYILFRTPCGR